jgi:hypothetical protein
MAEANYIFTGARGSGKSYALEALSMRRTRFVLIDPTSTVESMDYTSTNPREIAAVIRKYPNFRACLWCAHLSGPEFREALAPIAAAAESNRARWTTIAVDEVGVVAPGRQSLDEVERSARMGRHHRVSWWFSSQRLTDTSTNLRAQAERIFAFRTASAVDVERVKRDYGKEAAEALSDLEPFHYLAIDTQTREFSVRPPIVNPRRRK